MRTRSLVMAGLLSAMVVLVLPAAAADSGELLAGQPGGAIVRLSTTGAIVGQIAASGSGQQWSPDGARVAFTRRGSDGLAEIVVAELAGETRRVAAIRPVAAYVESLVWSPDGSTIAFVQAGSSEGEDVFTVPAGGGPARRLTTTEGYKDRLAWQPRGRLLLYDWSGITWVVDTETAATRRIGGSPAAWSPDGTEIATEGRNAIQVVAADGTPQRSIAGLPRESINGFAWSPDGRRIAFASYVTFYDLFSKFGTPALGNLYIVDRDGSNLRRLTGVPADAVCNWRRTTCDGSTETLRFGGSDPRWWPGGNRLFFRRASAVWTMNADGSCERRFSTPVYFDTPVWSPVAPPQPAVECVSTEVRIRWNGKPGGLRSGTAFSVFVRNDGTQTLSEAILEVQTNSDRVDGAGGARSVRDGHYLFRIGALAPGAETLVQLRAWGTATVQGSLLRAHVWNFVPPLVEEEPVPELLQVWATSCDDVGTRRGDKLVGTDQPERICGNGGADRISGRDGGDDLRGGEGADTIEGGRGGDVIDAGPGSDVVNVRDGERDTVDCGRGADRAVADAQDRLRGCERVARG